ncbi:Vimentin [Plecturocebus cupreus]
MQELHQQVDQFTNKANIKAQHDILAKDIRRSCRKRCFKERKLRAPSEILQTFRLDVDNASLALHDLKAKQEAEEYHRQVRSLTGQALKETKKSLQCQLCEIDKNFAVNYQDTIGLMQDKIQNRKEEVIKA